MDRALEAACVRNPRSGRTALETIGRPKIAFLVVVDFNDAIATGIYRDDRKLAATNIARNQKR